MILIGNSNIDCFNRLQLGSSTGEAVRVQWVGALVIDHFINSMAIGQKVRELYLAETGWKFLSIGTHDIYNLYLHAAHGSLETGFHQIVTKYEMVFTELAKRGKFAWLIFPQPIHTRELANLPVPKKLEITQRFNRHMEMFCSKKNIPVVNPLKQILGENNLARTEFLQKDGLHLNEHGATLYIMEIVRLSGVMLSIKKRTQVFEPQNENESFCTLLINNLNLPPITVLSAQNLTDRLVAFMQERADTRGLDMHIQAITPIASEGLFDSLDLVELYSCASALMDLEMNFNVNLREQDTIANIVKFIFTANKLKQDRTASPGYADFLTSLQIDFNVTANRPAILNAESNIGGLADQPFAILSDSYTAACEGNFCRYGTAIFWLALNLARRGEYKIALTYIKTAGDPRCYFPIPSSKIDFYTQLWRSQMPPFIWEKKISPEFILTPEGTPLV